MSNKRWNFFWLRSLLAVGFLLPLPFGPSPRTAPPGKILPVHYKKISPFFVSTIDFGKLECFPADKNYKIGRYQLHCETSALIYDGGKNFWVLADKRIRNPAYSPVRVFPISSLTKGLKDPQAVAGRNWSSPVWQSAAKLESITRLSRNTGPGKPVVFLAGTAFNKYKEGVKKFEPYNRLISVTGSGAKTACDGDQPKTCQTRVLAGAAELRAAFKAAIGKILPDKDQDMLPLQFIKLEGLAFVSRDELLFGFREIGGQGRRTHRFLILRGKLIYENGRPKKVTDIRPLADLNYLIDIPGGSLGLSSLETGPRGEWLYALTTRETNYKKDRVYSLLWRFPLKKQGLAKLNQPKLWQLARQQGAALPLILPHKGEGLTTGPNGNLWIIFDDDRLLETPAFAGSARPAGWKRKKNEASYARVKLP